jgi:putative transposase
MKASLAFSGGVEKAPYQARRPKMDAAFRRAVAEARQRQDLYFAGLLSEQHILDAFGKASQLWRGWIYTPAVTVWVFLSQCLSSDQSCRDAVGGLLAHRVAHGLKRCSAATGAYCAARDRIPEAAGRQLMRETGRSVDEQAPAKWRWLGHRVLDVDGSTITMPDTRANQASYPQQPNQRVGCGFPIARIVVVFSLATGVVLEAALGKYQGKQTGENSLFRTLHPLLGEGDVVLADRYYSGWFDMALILARGAHIVVRKHQLRPTDFRTGERLGAGDHLVWWKKPQRPAWMGAAQYADMPAGLTLREVRVRVTQKGFRTRSIVIVTTLLDAKRYRDQHLAKLYRRRWQAELNLRSLKTVMQLDHLRCHTPPRVRNEFFMHLTAYNLLRHVLAAASARVGREPWTVSFKGTLQTLNHMLEQLASTAATDAWCDALLDAVATHVVGNRPDRVEPRVKKRRDKSYPLMTKPRREYKR